jgi:hypothetical protein
LVSKRDGILIRSHSSAEILGAYLDAVLEGANEFDADDIARAIERRPLPPKFCSCWLTGDVAKVIERRSRPTYEERMR